MADFNIIKYMSGLTGYAFEKDVYERIALDRNVMNITDYSKLTDRDKDLLKADLLFTIYTSPNSSASYSVAHGNFKKSVGSQTINDKAGIYNVMVALYKKWGEEDKINLLTNTSSNTIILGDATLTDIW